tara:strand:- start:176 stop:634 length:459 start_codon:yes stop_codon:yes gene_type:complete
MELNTRREYTQVIFSTLTWRILLIEIFFISSFTGIYFSQWYIFGGTLLIFIISFLMRALSIIINIIFSSFWGLFAAVNSAFVQRIDFYTDNYIDSLILIFSTPSSQILGVIFFILSYIFHASGIESFRDIAIGVIKYIPGSKLLKRLIKYNP